MWSKIIEVARWQEVLKIVTSVFISREGQTVEYHETQSAVIRVSNTDAFVLLIGHPRSLRMSHVTDKERDVDKRGNRHKRNVSQVYSSESSSNDSVKHVTKAMQHTYAAISETPGVWWLSNWVAWVNFPILYAIKIRLLGSTCETRSIAGKFAQEGHYLYAESPKVREKVLLCHKGSLNWKVWDHGIAGYGQVISAVYESRRAWTIPLTMC